MKDTVKVRIWGLVWVLFLLIIIVLITCSTSSCIQHELSYEYYFEDPNTLHIESLHYKQNTLAMKTDRIMTEAAFADIITLKMDRSIQATEPNMVEAITGGIVTGAIRGGL